MPQPEASGKAFLGLIKYVKAEGGDDLLAQVVTAAGPSVQQALSRRIMVSDWLPYTVLVPLLEAMQNKMAHGNPSFFRAVGLVAGRNDIGTVFKIFKRLASLERLIRSCSSIWPSYYRNAGTMIATEWKPERTVVEIRDFAAMSPLHCRMMEGWMAATMEEVGAKVVSYGETRCMHRGDLCHEFTYVWRER